jgi:hypothetical protein
MCARLYRGASSEAAEVNQTPVQVRARAARLRRHWLEPELYMAFDLRATAGASLFGGLRGVATSLLA